jgi:RimJ/RimL family protein N-acetyltransferase
VRACRAGKRHVRPLNAIVSRPIESRVSGVLRTERLLMQPATVDDIEPLARMAGAAERVAALIRSSTQWWHTHGYGVWVILDPETQLRIGWCGLRPGNSPLAPELLYGLDRAVHGRGLATEAARAAVGFAFSLPGVRSVWAATGLNNAASAALMERIGMAFERRDRLDGTESLIYRVRKTDG